jgi:hypothetical protein
MLEENKEYPIGTLIDFRLYGFHTGRTFSVITSGRTILHGCLYQGYGDLFSYHGQLHSGIAFFRLEPEQIAHSAD